MTLLDCRGIQEYLGIGRYSAEGLMRKLPKIQVDGVKKVWVKKEDLDRLLEESTRV